MATTVCFWRKRKKDLWKKKKILLLTVFQNRTFLVVGLQINSQFLICFILIVFNIQWNYSGPRRCGWPEESFQAFGVRHGWEVSHCSKMNTETNLFHSHFKRAYTDSLHVVKFWGESRSRFSYNFHLNCDHELIFK